ncbi:uroporphyrinogen-III synthase [Exophiala viscosa]|uniref:Uroporphyrinogen-III synthase n=1 Tax=Exophiala viscosa TaxID=2486360 RepID=A0AAN6I960_9EURO|nr:uroporphyrinogen-III synthase [Exophiala viscosa]
MLAPLNLRPSSLCIRLVPRCIKSTHIHGLRLCSKMSVPSTVPILLLKTRSQPHDAYEEYFSTFESCGRSFQPQFVPVLEHRANAENLAELDHLLKSGGLTEKYGGMIFTSQRAVEAWTDVVKRVEQQSTGDNTSATGTGVNGASANASHSTPAATDDASAELVVSDFSFPLYTVGPATSRALQTLITASSSSSPFGRLRPSVVGEHTGNGAALAEYILSHYNALHAQKEYTFYDAPRLPFIPLLGPSRGERLEKDDNRIRKKGLLFLVGEQRRDIIPKTLMDPEGKLENPHDRIEVDEVEVYKTEIMESFQEDFQSRLDSSKIQGLHLVVVVVFSPQGCESMLRSLGFINESNALTERGRDRWSAEHSEGSFKSVIVTIGPTTRDHLVKHYAFEPDVCAAKPSAQGIGDGLNEFLKSKGLL